MSTTTDTPHKPKHRTGAGARFNPDTIWLYRAVNIGVLIVALAAVLVSWQGLNAVAAWFLPAAWTWLLPVMLDVAIVVFTLGILPRKARGESVWLLALTAYLLTSISSAANALHVILEPAEGHAALQVSVGAFLAALAPLLVLLTTEVLGLLITKPPSDQSPGRRAKRQAERIKELEGVERKLKKELKAAGEAEPRIVEVPVELTNDEILARAKAIRARLVAEEFSAPPLMESAEPARSVVDELQQEVVTASVPGPSQQSWWASTPRH